MLNHIDNLRDQISEVIFAFGKIILLPCGEFAGYDPRKKVSMEPQSEKPSKRKPGKQSGYTKERGEDICRAIETSVKGLYRLHEEDPNTYPAPSMFYRWLEDHEELRERYARAKINQAHFFGEEIIRIAYDDKDDVLRIKELPTAGGTKILVKEENREFVNRSKLKIETLWRLMQKLAPKVYGDQLENLDRDITIRVVEE